ncbi:MAG: class I SAM-dependent methyltransferase [Alphaproteobacteria bacterium]
MDGTPDFEALNEAKSNFDAVYNAADPRPYFRTLGRVDYAIPQNARPVFDALIAARRSDRDSEAVTVVDIGCSYGINAALLKHGLTLEELYQHYASPDIEALDRDALRAIDAERLYANPADPALTMIGLDVADRAVTYAERVGALDSGLAVNLEDGPVPAPLVPVVEPTDLIISTGCVGYVTDRTFDRLLGATGTDTPWVASFVLRMFPYAPIEATLADHGLVTEKLDGHFFTQRRFETAGERAQVLANLAELGIDPAGHEAEGRLVSEFFLSRPPAEVERQPLSTLLGSIEAGSPA